MWLIYAILLAGGAFVAGDETKVDVGGQFTLNVPTIGDKALKCYVVTPDEHLIGIIPTDESPERFEVSIPNAFMGCSVKVTDVVPSDAGLWEIHTQLESGETASVSYRIAVDQTEEEPVNPDVDGEETTVTPEVEDITWLPHIEYEAKTGRSISITLSKTPHSAVCTVHTPSGEVKRIDEDMAGVKAYGESEFVACGVKIGPLDVEDRTLFGNWTLCARYTEGEDQVRCQTAHIASNHHSWSSTIRATYDYVVHFSKTLRPSVRGLGTYQTCHVVTPLGEDIVMRPNVDYPYISFVRGLDVALCAVDIGPIHRSLLGEWTVYGTYRSVLGFNEVVLPMKLFLYDEDNPYNQAYNITELNPLTRVVNLGVIVRQDVTSTGNVDECSVTTPSGVVYDMLNDTNSEIVSFENPQNTATCRVAIGPITEELLAEWQVIGKFSRNGIYTEMRQKFEIEQEDPENPREDDKDRTIEVVGDEYFDTKISEIHRLTIRATGPFSEHESCHIRRPDNLQFEIMDGFNVTGIDIIHDPNNIACGIYFTVTSDNDVGDWILFSRDIILGTAYERRLQFTIYIEERVEPSIADVTVAEGNTLHLRLRNPTNLYSTCILTRPDGSVVANPEIDSSWTESCGFIVNNMRTSDSGTWVIQYGTSTIFKAPTEVSVIERWQDQQQNLFWSKDRPINILLGPENAIYCKIEDPSGVVVFDKFGRCNLSLERATRDHTGIWRMTIGLPGRIVTDVFPFSVTVAEPSSKPVVRTTVDAPKPLILMTCSVDTEEEVRACKFRDPSGRILLANQGIGEDRYTFHGIGSINASVRSHECGIRIEGPETRDLGLWRCAMETDSDIYYGFLTMLCPWAMMDPNVAAVVVSEPVLTARNGGMVAALEGHSVTMSCSIQSPIRYCYFRARNGTVFSVEPGVSTGLMEYVGAGLDAGECGIRFSTLQASDTGAWSCHVGFADEQEPEQRASFSVQIEEPITANQTLSNNEDWIYLESSVPNGRQLEYCRFVRIDGFGFTSNNLPDRYVSATNLAQGRCVLHIHDPTILDMHPWTVVARIAGQSEELSFYTRGSFRSNPPPTPDNPQTQSSSFVIWIVVIMLVLTVTFFAVLLCPKRNRRWTFSRAAAIRNSFRKSMQKTPLPDDNVNRNNTATAA